MALFQQIKDRLIESINRGDFPPGAKIPSENELVRQYGAARMTVNRAVKELAEEGVLIRVAGVGTYVAKAHLQHPSSSIVEVKDDIEQRGMVHTANVLRLARETPPASIRPALNDPTRPYFRSTIIHCADRSPILLEDRWVNPVIAPHYLDQDFAQTTPTRHLLKHAPLQRVEQTIAAVAPNRVQMTLLEVAAGEPLLLVTRRTWTSDQVASLVHLFYVGKRYVLRQGADALPAPQPLSQEELPS